LTDRLEFAGRALIGWAAQALGAGMALALLATGVSAAEPAPPAPTPRGPESPAGPVQRLTLEDAIRVALENNPGLLQAEANRLRAEDRVGEARAATLPQLHASGTYTLQGPVVSFPIQTGSGTQTVQLNRRDVKRAQITATLDTDIAGRQRALQRIARNGVRAA
jgi:outer membrane protein TolC